MTLYKNTHVVSFIMNKCLVNFHNVTSSMNYIDAFQFSVISQLPVSFDSSLLPLIKQLRAVMIHKVTTG